MTRGTRRLLATFAAGWMFCAGAGETNAGVNEWTPTGPEGGYVRAVAFHPSLPGVAFASSSSGLYRTTDDGQTWTLIRNDVVNGATRIVVDPSNHNRVVATNVAAIYLSNDAGLSFGAVTTPGNAGSIRSLAIAPTGNAIYVGRYDGRIFRSADGSQWEERSSGLGAAVLTPPGRGIVDLIFDPDDANTLYALVETVGVFKTTDGGMNWVLAGALPVSTAQSLAVDPGIPDELLTASNQGLYASTDGGATWSLSSAGSYRWVGYHPGQPASRIGAAVALASNGISIRRAHRLAAWTQTGTLKVVGLENAAFDPKNPDQIDSTLLVATTDGPLLTTDGGQSFAVRANGMRGAHAYHLISSFDGTIYAAYTLGATGLYRRGATGADPWTPLNNSALRANITEPFDPRAFAVDPNDSQTLLVASGTSLVRSIDGGQSWSPPSGEFALTTRIPRVIAFDPKDSNVVYAGTDAHGLFRSDDHGITWFQRAATPQSIGTLFVDPATPGALFAAALTSNLTPPPSYLYRSPDSGVTMTPAGSGITSIIYNMAANPANPQELFAAGRTQSGAPGLYRSTNAGQSWATIPGSDFLADDLAIDPLVPTTMVAVNNPEGRGAARSVDGGATWERMNFEGPGGQTYTMRHMILDPRNPHVIIASAEGYGLVEYAVSPDLEVSVLASPGTVGFGQSAPATVRVLNRGPLAASAVELTLTMPLSVTATVSSPPRGSCTPTARIVRCSFGALNSGQPLDTTFVINGDFASKQESWSASVAAHEPDVAGGNNSVVVPVAIGAVADLRLAFGPAASTIDHNSQITLNGTVTNGGPNTAADASVVLQIPSGLTYQSATSSQGACSAASGTVTCSLGTLTTSATATVSATLTASGLGELTVGAQAGASSSDSDPSNNSASFVVTSVNVANAGIQIAESANPATAGQSLQYTATISNAGPDPMPMTAATLTFTGTAASTATSPQGTCTVAGSTVTCALGTLAPNATATVNVATTPGTVGTATATANVTFQGTDPSTSNNSVSRSTPINAAGSSNGGGGGGGSTGILTLLALLAISSLRLSRRAQSSLVTRPARAS